MSELHLISVFMVGLLGSVHCMGMCGGIVSAFSVASRPVKAFPVPVTVAGAGAAGRISITASRVLAYNAGRIASYATAGAIAGGLAQGLRAFSAISSLQVAGYWLANLMLVALGLYLMDAWRGLSRLEAAGQVVWRHVQPLAGALLPVDNPHKALALGALWGWVPCGMAYSVLLTALASGSAASGTVVMTAFGLGTLPMLLAMGALGTRLQAWTKMRGVRLAGGVIVLAFGLIGLVRVANGLSLGWIDQLCVTPSAHAVLSTGARQ